MTTITLTDFDQLVAASRRNLEELLSERAAAEMAALALLTAQIEQSEAEQARVDAEQRRQAALEEFKTNALAAAQLSFADFHERANGLRAMARRCEDMHQAIIAGTMELERDAVTAVNRLIDALPEPSEENATAALEAAGLAGLALSLPSWLKSLNQKRWLSWPAVDSWTLEQLATGFVRERLKKR